MSEDEGNIPKLTSLCQHVIAKNLERYPPDSFSFLAETEWDSIIKQQYKLTLPKVKSCTSTPGLSLSGGRKKPMLADTLVREIEKHNPLLAKSKVTDSLVWKDCVSFRFKMGGMSRPKVMEYPWSVQLSRMQQIGNDLALFWREPKEYDDADFDVEAVQFSRTKRLKSHVQTLIASPMSIPLLSESSIGKAVKKFIKESSKRNSNLPPWAPDIHSVYDTPNPTYRGKSLLEQLDKLLVNWRSLASAKGASACDGRHRNTSEEQHVQDLESVQQCMEWRHLFEALVRREQETIKTRGKKMRKIRDDLESGRHQVQSTRIKTSNRKLGSKLLHGGPPGGSGGSGGGGIGGGGLSKLGKLKADSAARNATISGKSISNTSGFGCSVASSAGQKRKSSTSRSTGGYSINTTTKKNKKVFQLGGGKKLTIPRSHKRKR